MKNLLLLFMALLACAWISCSQPKTSTDAATAEAKKDSTAAPMPQAEFADAKYTAIGKAAFAALAKKDVDTWSKMFADKAVYFWNNGDSLAGKPAIQAYWADRMKNVVDSLWFSNEIYLPIKVNKPQATELPGVWLLSWYTTKAKYKSGKSMTQWMHALMHFDANDMVDQLIQFRDNAPIMAAMKK